MADVTLALLDDSTLMGRLLSLAGEERGLKVDFLLVLAEVERRKLYLVQGFSSLWVYCREALHLSEDGAWRRITAMRLLSRFPSLEAPLRDGRLSLTTLGLLREVLTAENLDDLLGRAAFKSKADVERLVVSVKPVVAPKDGLRRVPPTPAASASQLRPVDPTGATALALGPIEAAPSVPSEPAVSSAPTFALTAPVSTPAPSRPELRPVNGEQWSLRVTLDEEARAELEDLRNLLSHKVPDGNLAEVLKEAIRCAVEKHSRRKGAVGLAKAAAPVEVTVPVEAAVLAESAAPAIPGEPVPFLATPCRFNPRTVTADVRREVWARDEGCCSYVSPDGRRCCSRWQLELDHIEAEALGGPPTSRNLRLRCRSHNLWAAVETFGREKMAAFVPSLSLSLAPARAPLGCDGIRRPRSP
ncbi:MAG: HNH endonuclease [Anaeromyxobacter sp.]